MSRPRIGWRAWLASGVFIALLAGGVLISRPTEPGAPSAQPTPAPKSTAPASTIAQPPPPLKRADLIRAAELAASRYAAGEPPQNTVLAGRRFVATLPFGCAGPVADLKATTSGWTLDEETGTLRAKVVPETFTEAPHLEPIAGGAAFEAAEGFWIDRPWSLTEACPPGSAGPSSAPPDRQTLALVEFFGPGTQRARRREGRAYEAVKPIQADQAGLSQGLRLRVEGRLAPIGDAPPIGCWSETPQQRPTCVISARFERIAITDASGTRIFAEWSS